MCPTVAEVPSSKVKTVRYVAFRHSRTWAVALPRPLSSLDGEGIKDSGSERCICGYQFGHLSSHLQVFIEKIRKWP